MSDTPPEEPKQTTLSGEKLVGAVINNNYKIQQLISAGGMGEVYRGEQVFTGDPVAIKIVLPALAQDEKVLTLFKREARILSQLADEAIVRYFNFVHDPDLDRFCLIMDFIDGIPLSDQVASDGPISLDSARRLLVRLAKGLDKAHQREVTHRDLSPDNVMLPDGDVDRAVLIDFGIAKSTEMTEGTLHGQFAGKFKYISPEQLGHFDGIISPRTDIYGLALLIAAAMRGTAIDMGASVVEAVNARRAIPDLSGIFPELQPLMAHMLEPDPAMRPPRMLDVAGMVEDPSKIPMRYTGGAPLMGATVDSDATIITTMPPVGTMPPTRSVPPQDATMVAGIQNPPGLSTPQAAPVPQTAPFQNEVSQSPFGGGSVAPFSEVPSEQSSAPVPILPPKTSGGVGKWIAILVVLAGLGGGGWYAMDQGLIPGLGTQSTDTTTAETADPTQEPVTPQTVAGSMPAPDESTRQGFLAAYGADDGCSYATRITSGIDAGKLEVISDKAEALASLSSDYSAAFGPAPDTVQHQVTSAQCAALDLARGLQGRADVEPVLTLDSNEIVSGGFLVGRVRDVRGRSLWMGLVTGTGEVFDVSANLSSQPDGSATFQFGLGLAANAKATPQVLVAIAASEPILSLAAFVDGEPADKVLRVLQSEIEAREGGAAASLGWIMLSPPGE